MACISNLSLKWFVLGSIVLLLCLGLLPYDVYAQTTGTNPYIPPNFYFNTTSCVTVGQTNAIMTNFVNCTDSAIRSATLTLVDTMSRAIAPAIAAISVYAIALHGIKIIGGAEELTAQTAGFLIRLALVNFFFFDIGGFAGQLFSIMNELAGIMGFTPWQSADTSLGYIMGYDASDSGHRVLYHGTLAMVASALFSGPAGVAMMSSGVIAMFELLMFGMEIVYVYLLSVLMLSLCIIVSPLIIPLALFSYADRYFKKWLSNVIGAILVPMFLFGFLQFTLDLFSGQILQILHSLNPIGHTDNNYGGLDYYPPYATQDNVFLSWIKRLASGFAKFASDVYHWATDLLTHNVPATNPTMDSRAKNAAITNPFSYWALTFGSNPEANMFKVVTNFVLLWIYASVLIGMIKKIPGLALEIAGSQVSIDMQSQSIAQKIGETAQNLKIGGGALIGGVAGGQLGAGITKSAAGRGAATVTGAIIGTLVSRRI